MCGLNDYFALALDVRFVRALSSAVAPYFLNETFDRTISHMLSVSLRPLSEKHDQVPFVVWTESSFYLLNVHNNKKYAMSDTLNES